ncbi:MAG TPA: aldolase/citrate lyase family protein, partial [Acetobacteraceae bacterium]|nr:aldolase/citrate lyase family protein [Acetobacteraceae bacterium]
MPADSARFVAAAARRGADAIILDLEDAIAPAAKESARRALADHADALAAQGLPVVIRVNAEPELLAADIAAAARPSVAAIMLPKVTSAADIVRIGAADIGLIPLIETPRGVMAAAEIAGADPRIAAL